MQFAKFARLVFALPLLLPTVGCGKPGRQVTVHGEVTLNGAPLERGSILFAPAEGTSGTVTGCDIKDGHYQISGAKAPAIGWNRVEITATRPTGKMVQDPYGPPGRMVEIIANAVAARFNSTSTLKLEIKPEDNTANFEVQSE